MRFAGLCSVCEWPVTALLDQDGYRNVASGITLEASRVRSVYCVHAQLPYPLCLSPSLLSSHLLLHRLCLSSARDDLHNNPAVVTLCCNLLPVRKLLCKSSSSRMLWTHSILMSTLAACSVSLSDEPRHANTNLHGSLSTCSSMLR